MASSTLTAKPSSGFYSMNSNEFDAAQALLGVSPPNSSSGSSSNSFRLVADQYTYGPVGGAAEKDDRGNTCAALSFGADHPEQSPVEDSNNNMGEVRIQRRPRSDSAGLDALAALASSLDDDVSASNEHDDDACGNDGGHSGTEHNNGSSVRESPYGRNSPLAPPTSASSYPDENNNSADHHHDQAIPPPPARRRRSASNPEGMEKWDSYNDVGGRRQFFLPASILEVELAEASAAVQKHHSSMILSIPEDTEFFGDEEEDASLDDTNKSTSSSTNSKTKTEAPVDEKDLSPEELLRRARSRLLEDLSECNVNGEKGVLLLPHSLAKYKEVYNKNGRIGIYTAAERAAIISKFKGKRSRRVWNKKIRYNCRKSLADRRLRVKGRFVKRSEQEQLARELLLAEQEAAREKQAEKENTTTITITTAADDDDDEEMLDMRDDPEAGFVPTEDQPYRRLRRHTIT